MNKSAKIDMTRGPIMKLVVLFALPICLGNILQQLYNTVDTLVIGNFCGTTSQAAVGTCAQPVELFLCIFLGLGTGVSILVSQYTGSGDKESLKKSVSTAVSFLYMCAIPVTVLGVFVSPLILLVMRVPDEAWNHCVSYLNIIFFGTLGNLGYNMNAGILRGVGDSRASLLFLVISCIVNIVLDLLFVAGFRMDVSGAALATAIAMFCSWFFSIGYIKKKYPELEFTVLPKKFDRQILKQIVSIGLPLGLNNSIYSTKLTGIANVAINSFSSAATTFAGQNLGAKNYARLKKGGLMIPFCSGLYTCTAGLIFTFFCEPILALFTKDAAVLAMAVRYIRIVLPFTWTYAVFNGIICFVNGIGEVKYPTVVNIMMLWLVRIPVGYFIAAAIDGTYIMACFPISFAFGMFCMLAFFFTKKWKEIRRLAAESN